jgi:hypothetical protein
MQVDLGIDCLVSRGHLAFKKMGEETICTYIYGHVQCVYKVLANPTVKPSTSFLRRATTKRLLLLCLCPCSLQDGLQDEHAKRRKWHEENVRRKHNYVPLLFGMLKHLAEHDKLQPLIERARNLPGGPSS